VEKKPESSWEEAERVGPYQLHEQLPQDDLDQGELYRATHERSGVTALVLKPSTVEGEAPLKDWRVRYVSSSSHNYLAVEVEDSRWSTASGRHSVEALMCLLEDMREGVRRMADALPLDDAPRPWRRLGLALAGVAAVGALLFVLVRTRPVSQPLGEPEHLTSATPAPMSDEVTTDMAVPLVGNSSPRDIEDGGTPAIALPFPRKPYKGQKRPPCTPRVEVEIMGACWVPHELKAPCPEELYEYQGKCYTTSMLPPSLPQSLGQ
jgi:hypothetical protein